MARITTVLKNYRQNRRLAQLLRIQIAEMEKKDSDAVITSDTVLDHRFNPNGIPKHIVGFNVQEYDRKRKKLRETEKEIRSAEEWVAAIEDDITREVFHVRYLEGWTWAKIAARVGYEGNEDYPRICIHDAHLRKIGIK